MKYGGLESGEGGTGKSGEVRHRGPILCLFIPSSRTENMTQMRILFLLTPGPDSLLLGQELCKSPQSIPLTPQLRQ